MTNKAVVMGTRAQATANVTTRRRLADVSNANAIGKQPGADKPSIVPQDAENKQPLNHKTQDLKPSLGLKKSLATRNLLSATTTTTQKAEEVKEPVKEDSAAVVVAKPDAFSVDSLRDFIEDIDAADGDNPQLCAEYVKDIYDYLRQLEQLYAVQADYLTMPAGSKVKSEINGKMRAILIDWLIQVGSAADEMNLCRLSLLDVGVTRRIDGPRHLQSHFLRD